MEQNRTISRRGFGLGLASTALLTAGCQSSGTSSAGVDATGTINPTAYAAVTDGGFHIPAVNLDRINKRFLRQKVSYKTKHPVGTVIVDTKRFYLYLVEPNGKAWRYGVGLGRAGFEWSGEANIKSKQKWPKWFPPAEMIEREPHLEKYSAENGGHPPGLNNALGSRALYIYEGNKDTLYRLHGSREVNSIGKAVSSGCVRLLNQDIIHLYDRVKPGAKIIVT